MTLSESSKQNPQNISSKQTLSPLAVLMPAYNEEKGIELAVNEVIAEVLNKVENSYLIVVNDGSSDQTGAILDKLKSKEPRLEIIHKPNQGHGPALVSALNKAQSEHVFLIDSDMQIPLSCFPNLWNLLNGPGVDAVFGLRENRKDPKLRLLLSKFIALVLGTLFQVKLGDSNAPCKLFRKKIWNELSARLHDDLLLAPSIVIAIYAKRHKYNIIETPVPHRARSLGEPSLRIKVLMRFCWKAFTQVLTLKEALW